MTNKLPTGEARHKFVAPPPEYEFQDLCWDCNRPRSVHQPAAVEQPTESVEGKSMDQYIGIKCRLCKRGANEIKGFLDRVNEKGVPGIWECRPACETSISKEDAVVMAITGRTNTATPSVLRDAVRRLIAEDDPSSYSVGLSNEDVDHLADLVSDTVRGQDVFCTLAGPGRGDCEHFVGMPAVLDETTTDCYGKPLGWCAYCWLSHRYASLERQLATSESTQSVTPPQKKAHVLLTKDTCPCDKRSDTPCNVCDGGLAICSVCGKAEAELDEPCVPAAPEPQGEALASSELVADKFYFPCYHSRLRFDCAGCLQGHAARMEKIARATPPATAEAEDCAECAAKDAEVRGVLNELGSKTIRVRETGEPEDVYASLAVSVAKLCAATVPTTDPTNQCTYCQAREPYLNGQGRWAHEGGVLCTSPPFHFVRPTADYEAIRARLDELARYNINEDGITAECMDRSMGPMGALDRASVSFTAFGDLVYQLQEDVRTLLGETRNSIDYEAVARGMVENQDDE